MVLVVAISLVNGALSLAAHTLHVLLILLLNVLHPDVVYPVKKGNLHKRNRRWVRCWDLPYARCAQHHDGMNGYDNKANHVWHRILGTCKKAAVGHTMMMLMHMSKEQLPCAAVQKQMRHKV